LDGRASGALEGLHRSLAFATAENFLCAAMYDLRQVMDTIERDPASSPLAESSSASN
jgi:hypothetical protein